jgi:hypothetical protein
LYIGEVMIEVVSLVISLIALAVALAARSRVIEREHESPWTTYQGDDPRDPL